MFNILRIRQIMSPVNKKRPYPSFENCFILEAAGTRHSSPFASGIVLLRVRCFPFALVFFHSLFLWLTCRNWRFVQTGSTPSDSRLFAILFRVRTCFQSVPASEEPDKMSSIKRGRYVKGPGTALPAFVDENRPSRSPSPRLRSPEVIISFGS